MYTKGFYGGKFLPFHRGHLHCVLEASSSCEELHVILFHSSKEEVEILKSDMRFDKKLLSPKIREMVIRREFKDFPHIKIDVVDCSKLDPRDGFTSWENEALEVEKVIGKFDVIYSSEESYSPIFQKLYPFAAHELVDIERIVVPISGTAVRNMTTMQAYEFLPRTYQEFANRSVLIVGTESCGKSTLTKKLAKYFNTSYTNEYGRDICEEYGTGQPDISLYNTIVYGQKMAEREASMTANKVYFCDTEAIVTEYYAVMYENTHLPVASAVAIQERYDLVIYLEPTNRWVADGYRKDGEEEVRQANDKQLKALFDWYGMDIHILSGTYYENYSNAIKLVRKMMEQ